MMKTLIGALSLTFAAPALAQAPAPAVDPHAHHKGTDHGKMDHSKMDHGKMACCKEAKSDCCKDGKGDCCKHGKAEVKPADASHAGHDH